MSRVVRRPLVGTAAVLLAVGLAACSGGDEVPGGAAGATTGGAATAVPTAASVDASAPPAGPSGAPTSVGVDPSVAGTAPSAVAAPTTTTTVTAGPAPAGTPAAAPARPTAGAVPEMPPAQVGDTVDAGGGLRAEVVDLAPSRIVGGVPGDVAGPAVEVTVAVTNTGGQAADVGFVVVSAAYGDGQEASGFEGGSSEALTGSIPAGQTRQGVYIFGVPELGTGTLVVRVGTDPERPLAVFTADASDWSD